MNNKYYMWGTVLNYFYIGFILLILNGCYSDPGANIIDLGRPPDIIPDYTGIIIPPNIAPLNFLIRDKGSAYCVRFFIRSEMLMEVTSKSGKILIPEKKWKKILQNNSGEELTIHIYTRDNDRQWFKFNTISNTIAREPIDPFLSYRLLYPGYEAYTELSIKQRCVENFKEHSLVENSIIDKNCINCHTFNPENSANFLFHVRGSMGGTYLYSENVLKKINLRTTDMKNNAVYPRWHPSGRFIAFSSNKTVQFFHSSDAKKVEVVDVTSSLILYDIDKNEVMQVDLPEKEMYMDTYPEWSPDGRFLYFCRAEQPAEDFEHEDIKYNLYRISFEPENCEFGVAELIFDAKKMNQSATFPRISPNGKFLVLTLHDYGCFPIWHKEADLYSINLETFTNSKLDLNSDFSESYHSWSSNSKWLVFSSKRADGLTARPYISYIEENGKSGKPFILPQKDPEFYNKLLKTYNIPELTTTKIILAPGKLRSIAKSEALQAN